MEGTPLLRLFLPRPGFTRYVVQRSLHITMTKLNEFRWIGNLWFLSQFGYNSPLFLLLDKCRHMLSIGLRWFFSHY